MKQSNNKANQTSFMITDAQAIFYYIIYAQVISYFITLRECEVNKKFSLKQIFDKRYVVSFS